MAIENDLGIKKCVGLADALFLSGSKLLVSSTDSVRDRQTDGRTDGTTCIAR